MAFAKSRSKKCPICVGCTPSKVEEINGALGVIMADVRDTGTIPKAQDQRFNLIAHRVGLSPFSLHYHLKECLLDREIQDQRLLELKDIAVAIATAKQEYLNFPNQPNSNAYTGLLNAFMALSSQIEGKQDPEMAVEFVIETVISPMSRKTLGALTEELRGLRDILATILPKTQVAYIDSQLKASLSRMSSQLRDSMDDGLRNLCTFYKVELEAKSRKRALEGGTTPESPVAATPADHTDDDGGVVH